MRRRALIQAVTLLAGDARDVAESHLMALERLGTQGRTGDSQSLPRGVVAVLLRDDLLLRLAGKVPTPLPEGEAGLAVPGETGFGPLTLRAAHAVEAGATSAEVDAAAAGGLLTVRRRRPGDSMQPLGMGGRKKLQDLFVDEHVAREQRDCVPIFLNQRGIVWAGGLRIAEWARPRPGEPTLHLSYRLTEVGDDT
jgi:tRNA(Ile)-lysidine synthase